jgi:aspartate/methionine/tyrosine aminotransferase
MLKKARVEYLAWAKEALSRADRVSLLLSGLVTPLERLQTDPRDILRAEEPLFGDPTVRAALANRYRVREDEVFAVLGTSMGLFLACAAILEPGDAVLVETPGYESLFRVPEALEARVMPFTREETEGFALNPERILNLWTPETRMVLVSDLHNPTGTEAGDEALDILGREAERRGGLILVDEVYRDFRPGPVATARTLGNGIVAVSSLTKVYGLGRLRAGWIFAPVSIVERLQAMINLFEAVDPAPLQPLFRQALAQAESLREAAFTRSREGWNVVERWRRDHPALRVVSPDGGIFAWAVLPEGWTGTTFAERLLHEEGVAVTPGRFFGDDSGFRFSFGLEDLSLLEEGLAAMDRVAADA